LPGEHELDPRIIILNVLVLIWGLRMSTYVFLRTYRGEEDRRFASLRTRLMDIGGPILFYCVSFFGIYMMNGVVIVAINSSALYVSMFSQSTTKLGALDFIGIIVWVIGFSILVVSDHQLRLFKLKRRSNETNGERLLKRGMWSYSRHPNYFGECMLWWGIYLIACGADNKGWITVWSPILISVLLRFGSGVPMNEELYKDDEEYDYYKKVTNVFVPMPRKDKEVANANMLENKYNF